jgi:hypothetical protein
MLNVNEVVSKPDLKAAVLEGIALTIESNKNAKEGFGLAGIERWADLIASTKSKQGWPALFTPGAPMVDALIASYNWLELMSGGAALRPLYAEFLDEAAAITKKTKLSKVAEEYRKVSVLWSDFAQALLPEGVARFKYVREALNKKHKAISMGAAAQSDAEKATKEIASTRKTASDKPLTEAETKEFYGSLRARLEAIHEAETKALASLASAVK